MLLFSPLVPFQQFGLVTAMTILFALVAAIVVVPPMLAVWAAYHRWRQETGDTELFATPPATAERDPTTARADGWRRRRRRRAEAVVRLRWSGRSA